MEEAARDLGAGPRQAFFHVTLPLIAPAVAAGALLAFALSFDDLIITSFNAGVGSSTLPLYIYSRIRFGVTPEINAISTIVVRRDGDRRAARDVDHRAAGAAPARGGCPLVPSSGR